MLDLKPSQVLMVAAHNGDLRAAKAQGLGPVFVPRLTEHGPHQQIDVVPNPSCVDMVAVSFTELATKLGCREEEFAGLRRYAGARANPGSGRRFGQKARLVVRKPCLP